MAKEPLGVSLTKLILAVTIMVSVGATLGVAGYIEAKINIFNNADEFKTSLRIDKADDKFTLVAQKGEGLTHLARRAIKEYLKNSNDSLDKEQSIYAEDYLKVKLKKKYHRLWIGDKVEIDPNLIKEAILQAKKIIACGTIKVTDTDGNIYNTVQIGSQCWLRENLKVTKNPNRESITRYCYNNDPKICDTDGGLYDWNTAMDNSAAEGMQGICPVGWHVPKDSEWYELENGLVANSLENTFKETSCSRIRNNPVGVVNNACEPAGKNLQINGSSEFDALLVGGRWIDESFGNRGAGAYLWSSTESESDNFNAWSRDLYRGYLTVARNSSSKAYGFSVRCLKN